MMARKKMYYGSKNDKIVNKYDFIGLIMVNVGGGLLNAEFFLYFCTRNVMKE